MLAAVAVLAGLLQDRWLAAVAELVSPSVRDRLRIPDHAGTYASPGPRRPDVELSLRLLRARRYARRLAPPTSRPDREASGERIVSDDDDSARSFMTRACSTTPPGRAVTAGFGSSRQPAADRGGRATARRAASVPSANRHGDRCRAAARRARPPRRRPAAAGGPLHGARAPAGDRGPDQRPCDRGRARRAVLRPRGGDRGAAGAGPRHPAADPDRRGPRRGRRITRAPGPAHGGGRGRPPGRDARPIESTLYS